MFGNGAGAGDLSAERRLSTIDGLGKLRRELKKGVMRSFMHKAEHSSATLIESVGGQAYQPLFRFQHSKLDDARPPMPNSMYM